MAHRLVFAGSSAFAVPTLEGMAAADADLVAVVTQPDRPAGRRRRLTPTPVAECAGRLGLPLWKPDTLKTPEALETLAGYEPDLLVVVDFGMLLPAAVLDLPRLGCVNGHASLLPRWRGAAPIERAVLAGDAETGITVMQMDEGLDTGPILAMEATPIGPGETAGEVRERMAELCATVLVRALPDILAGRVEARPQPEDGACYAKRLTTAEAAIDWTSTAAEIARAVRAFNPRPGAHTMLEDLRLKILRGHALRGRQGAAPGTVLAASADGIDVATGEGLLRIEQLQAPGKRPMTARDFLNGHDVLHRRLG